MVKYATRLFPDAVGIASNKFRPPKAAGIASACGG